MGLLNWMRGGGQWRRWAQDIGKAGDMALQLASWELAEQRKAQTDEESILTGTATDLTRQWGVLDNQLQSLLESGFSERDINELKREASERRANALGATSFVRGRNADRGTYQPIYNIFQEIVDAQIEIWDSLLTTLASIDPNDLESFDPSDLDSVRYLLRHCGWLGEQALSTLPDLTRQRRQAERRNQARAAWGCVGIIALAALIGGLAAYCL